MDAKGASLDGPAASPYYAFIMTQDLESALRERYGLTEETEPLVIAQLLRESTDVLARRVERRDWIGASVGSVMLLDTLAAVNVSIQALAGPPVGESATDFSGNYFRQIMEAGVELSEEFRGIIRDAILDYGGQVDKEGF